MAQQPKAADIAFDELENAVAASISDRWSTPPTVKEQFATKYLQLCSRQFEFRLYSDQDERLFFITIGLRWLANCGPHCRLDELDELSRNISYCLRSLDGTLDSVRVRHCITNALSVAVKHLSDSCDPDLGSSKYAVFLNALLELKVHWGGDDLFRVLLEECLLDTSLPSMSASLLVFFYKVRNTGGDGKIYRDPIVLDAAFNKELLRQHWNSGGDFLVACCSEQYADVIRLGVLSE